MKTGQGFFIDLIRGGQITIHYIRMAKQVFKTYMTMVVVITAILFVVLFLRNTTPLDRGYAFNYSYAFISVNYLGSFNPDIYVTVPGHQSRKLKASTVVNSPFLKSRYDAVFDQAKSSFFISFLSLIVGFLLVMVFIKRTGRQQSENKKIRGGEIVNVKDLSKKIKLHIHENKNIGEGVGICSVADIALPKSFEVTNFLLIGDQGVGKSQTIIENLISIREIGGRAIIYDPSGETTRKFYNPKIDIILNPLDSRSRSWNIWNECTHEYQVLSLVEAFIDDEGRPNDFFVKASRIVFSALIMKTRTLDDLMRAAYKLSLEDLAYYLKGTEASAIIDMEGAKAAHSVRAVLVANISSLKYTGFMSGDNFSINNWVREVDTGFLFISCPPQQLRMLRPLVSVWIDCALNSILGLTPNRDNRIITSIDELATLNKIPVLEPFLAQARKYGNVSFLGVQNYSQLKAKYGEPLANAIFGLCGTWAVFRSSEYNNAKWLSDNLYKEDVVEPNENNSFGANEMRDGVSVNRSRHQRELVTPTEIQSLPDLTAYLRIGRGFPIAKIKQKYRELDDVASDFSPVEDDGFLDVEDFEGDFQDELSFDEERKQSKKRASSDAKKIDYTDIDFDF